MQKIPRKPRLRGVPRIAFAAALTALTLWTVSVAATAHSLSDAAERLRQETALPLAPAALRDGRRGSGRALPRRVARAESDAHPCRRAQRGDAGVVERAAAPARRNEARHRGSRGHNAFRRTDGETVPRGADNGVPSRTLRVGDPSGYTVLGERLHQ